MNIFKGRSPVFWLAVAAVFFIGVSLAMYGISAAELLPGLTWGKGFWHFAIDSSDFYGEAVRLAQRLQAGEWYALWTRLVTPDGMEHGFWYSNWHVRLYALSFLVFGQSPVAAIPLNALVYLLVLVVVYSTGMRLWGARTGFWSAAIVACWPSALLHMTQMLKDPFFILGQLLFVYGLVLLAGGSSHRQDIAWGCASAITGLLLILSVRPNSVILNWVMWVFISLFVICQAVFIRGTSRIFRPVAALLSLMIITGISHEWLPIFPGRPASSASLQEAGSIQPRDVGDAQQSVSRERKQRLMDSLATSVQHQRVGWFESQSGESLTNIDAEVQFNSLGSLVGYLPKALQIGLMAPFPSMWFTEGRRVGRIGRLVAGLETGVMYVVLFFAGICVFKEYRRPELWMLVFFTLTGMLSLGLMVPNVGVLFRARYVFWFAILIPAVHVATELVLSRARRPHGVLGKSVWTRRP